ncbi:AMIN-like domain-containing (lipo)protein [Ruania albidiflava]|uniref:AMIN-like domain-containing (lipo)protein n=1 Tax=Ruania albidiflava TaxID=366586 RepID=UPI00040EFEB2|nr:hypothetical protein [Ruania albidiflava]
MVRLSVLPMTAVLTVAVLLTSCTGSPEAEHPTSPSPTSAPATGTQEPSEAPSDEPTSQRPSGTDSGPPSSDLEPFPEHAQPVQSEASTGAELLLVDLTSGEHESYDRVVLTFKGDGTPGWRVGYEDNPAEDGSGRPIDTEGDASLVAQVSGLVLPTEGDGQVPPGTTMTDLPEIEEMYLAGWFEGQAQLVLGIDSAEAPFRVFALTDPTRLVIDVQHVDD